MEALQDDASLLLEGRNNLSLLFVWNLAFAAVERSIPLCISSLPIVRVGVYVGLNLRGTGLAGCAFVSTSWRGSVIAKQLQCLVNAAATGSS